MRRGIGSRPYLTSVYGMSTEFRSRLITGQAQEHNWQESFFFGPSEVSVSISAASQVTATPRKDHYIGANNFSAFATLLATVTKYGGAVVSAILYFFRDRIRERER